MASHYRRLNNVKSQIDQSIPKGFLYCKNTRVKASPRPPLCEPYRISCQPNYCCTQRLYCPSMYSHFPNHSANVKKHDCLTHQEKIPIVPTFSGSARSQSVPNRTQPGTSEKKGTTRPKSVEPLIKRVPFSKSQTKRAPTQNKNRGNHQVKSKVDSPKSTVKSPSRSLSTPESRKAVGSHVEKSVSPKRSGAADYEYLHFLLRITEDILRNDLYSNGEMQSVFDSHFQANKGRLDEKKMLQHIEKLKKDLNFPLKRAPTTIPMCLCDSDREKLLKQLEKCDCSSLSDDTTPAEFECIPDCLTGNKLITLCSKTVSQTLEDTSETPLEEELTEKVKMTEDNTEIYPPECDLNDNPEEIEIQDTVDEKGDNSENQSPLCEICTSDTPGCLEQIEKTNSLDNSDTASEHTEQSNVFSITGPSSMKTLLPQKSDNLETSTMVMEEWMDPANNNIKIPDEPSNFTLDGSVTISNNGPPTDSDESNKSKHRSIIFIPTKVDMESTSSESREDVIIERSFSQDEELEKCCTCINAQDQELNKPDPETGDIPECKCNTNQSANSDITIEAWTLKDLGTSHVTVSSNSNMSASLIYQKLQHEGSLIPNSANVPVIKNPPSNTSNEAIVRNVNPVPSEKSNKLPMENELCPRHPTEMRYKNSSGKCCKCTISFQKVALKIKADPSEVEDSYVVVEGPVCLPKRMLETQGIPVLIENLSSVAFNPHALSYPKTSSQVNYLADQETNDIASLAIDPKSISRTYNPYNTNTTKLLNDDYDLTPQKEVSSKYHYLMMDASTGISADDLTKGKVLTGHAKSSPASTVTVKSVSEKLFNDILLENTETEVDQKMIDGERNNWIMEEKEVSPSPQIVDNSAPPPPPPVQVQPMPAMLVERPNVEDEKSISLIEPPTEEYMLPPRFSTNVPLTRYLLAAEEKRKPSMSMGIGGTRFSQALTAFSRRRSRDMSIQRDTPSDKSGISSYDGSEHISVNERDVSRIDNLFMPATDRRTGRKSFSDRSSLKDTEDFLEKLNELPVVHMSKSQERQVSEVTENLKKFRAIETDSLSMKPFHTKPMHDMASLTSSATRSMPSSLTDNMSDDGKSFIGSMQNVKYCCGLKTTKGKKR